MENKNQPAFPDTMRAAPQSYLNQHPEHWPTGLTKRELIAAMALQGLCASEFRGHMEAFVSKSVQLADLLLSELEKTQP